MKVSGVRVYANKHSIDWYVHKGTFYRFFDLIVVVQFGLSKERLWRENFATVDDTLTIFSSVNHTNAQMHGHR